MKRFRKAIAMISTLLLLGSGFFVSCAGDDDEDETPKSQPGSGQQAGTGGGQQGGSGQGQTGNTEYTVSFAGDNSTGNASTYKDGVYTITLATANSSDWQNQIFINNPNTAANLSAGDKVYAVITAKADKPVEKLVFKDQFNGGSYSGIDNLSELEGLEAGVAKTFMVSGTVANDYDTSSSLVIDVRGNEAGTKLELSDIKVEKLGDYTVSKIKLSASTTSASTGEKITLTAKDQYGFAIEGVIYEITSANAVSTLEGNVLTTGNTAENVTVKASYGSLEASVEITVTSEKDFGKYFTVENASSHGEDVAKENPGYVFLWSNNTLSDVSATEIEYKFTRSSTSEWWGTQVFYAAEKGKYAVIFKVTSSVAGGITVNNTAYDLEAGTSKKIAFIKELGGTDTLISLQLGVNGVSVLPEGTFAISDFSVTEISNLDPSTITVESVEIAPATKTIAAGEKVTFSATINELFPVDANFAIAEEIGISGSSISGSELTAGTPTEESGTISVTASYGGKTSVAAVITVLAGKDYSKYFKVGSQFGTNDPFDNDYLALWYVGGDWNCGEIVSVTAASATENGCTVTRANTGSYDWSTQILYRAAAGKYKVSLKAKSTVGGKIAVLPAANADEKKEITLEADTLSEEISFTATLAEGNKVLLQVNLGSGDDILPAGTFTITDFVVTPDTDTGSGVSGESGNTETTEPGSIDWSKIDWIGASGDKYKISADGMTVVNVQQPGWASEQGIYMHGEGGISACTLGSGTDGTDFKIDGAGIVVYLSKFTKKETAFTVTNTGGTHNITVFYADGTEN